MICQDGLLNSWKSRSLNIVLIIFFYTRQAYLVLLPIQTLFLAFPFNIHLNFYYFISVCDFCFIFYIFSFKPTLVYLLVFCL